MAREKVRVDLNISGFEELRTSAFLKADLLARGNRVAAACNAHLSAPGYKAELSPSKNRARVTVFPETYEAMNSEAQHNHLIRNLDAAR